MLPSRLTGKDALKKIVCISFNQGIELISYCESRQRKLKNLDSPADSVERFCRTARTGTQKKKRCQAALFSGRVSNLLRNACRRQVLPYSLDAVGPAFLRFCA